MLNQRHGFDDGLSCDSPRVVAFLFRQKLRLLASCSFAFSVLFSVRQETIRAACPKTGGIHFRLFADKGEGRSDSMRMYR
jgi:hypothetical protein